MVLTNFESRSNLYCNPSGGVAAGNRFGSGSASMPTWMDSLACTGIELSLSRCTFAGWGTEDCTHSEDISVTCDEPKRMWQIMILSTFTTLLVQS